MRLWPFFFLSWNADKIERERESNEKRKKTLKDSAKCHLYDEIAENPNENMVDPKLNPIQMNSVFLFIFCSCFLLITFTSCTRQINKMRRYKMEFTFHFTKNTDPRSSQEPQVNSIWKKWKTKDDLLRSLRVCARVRAHIR